MREFSAALLEPFGLRARRFTRAYGAFICDTNQGTMLVKEAAEPEGALLFAHGAKEYLARQGFLWTDRYQMSREGRPWAVVSGEMYTVRSWMRAEEANLTDPSCVMRMAGMLGRFQRLSGGYEAPTQARCISRCYEWPDRVYKGCHRLQSYGRNLRKNGRYTEFDLMVLSCLPEHKEQAEQAKQFFMSDTYTQLAQRADQRRCFGHGNYTDHTVLLGKSHSMITDFEEACYMIPVADLIALAERVLRKNDWSLAMGMNMLEAYDRWYPMDQAERAMLHAGLLYPSRLLNLCGEAYHTKRSWMPVSYKRKLEELLQQQEKRKEFLEELGRRLAIK